MWRAAVIVIAYHDAQGQPRSGKVRGGGCSTAGFFGSLFLFLHTDNDPEKSPDVQKNQPEFFSPLFTACGSYIKKKKEEEELSLSGAGSFFFHTHATFPDVMR